ncbi:hypothetical protein ABB37_01571 [Leptomonas pyrrhocoris]|uniref:Uncharacterized protein n=1 Tax=Leptomonas pyrrhocoris TaxID=157538 RepID=A0A0M9G8V5_LEPPY|nr:hypothetical protein ABB37_01571 [Leptomonas pyrrhocoris]KPA85210.1 hypothetical protein ABB37_01571 [Leptomonas pyrrhocoris]|eukprot:XP_015663649.1 hypothetical protein ABB37_01571 [Leptomonas pyrrhocoris]
MQSWYMFGYSGFPTGEQRRRFYRQRDDPCESEEECDYDDETNDRPIFYYPLHESEEGSRSSYDSTFSSASSYASDEEAHIDAKRGGPNDQHKSSLRIRRHTKRLRRTSQAGSSMQCVSHSTLYEDMPAWYGATAVTLSASLSVSFPSTETFVLQHGGAPCASPFSISNQTSLWHWSATSSKFDGISKDEARGSLRCARVRDDASLLSHLRWDRLHPTLRLAHSSAARAPLPRMGHCAVCLSSLDSSLLQYFLTEHSRTDSSSSTSACTDQNHLLSTSAKVALGLLVNDDVELYGSIILGGASQLVSTNSCSCSSPERRRSGGVLLGEEYAPASDTVASPTEPNLDGAVIPHTSVFSHPALCVTLLSTKDKGVTEASPALRQHTVFFPLDTSSISIVAPRAFATLTPWADRSAEATAVHSFAYIGGTENGRDPLAFLELEVFRLHLETWSWSCNPVTTYGAKPAPRFGHSASMADEDRYFLMFGGVGAGHVYLNDLHVLDVHTRVWREVFFPCGLNVPRRAFHVCSVLTDTPTTPAMEKKDCAPASSSEQHSSAFALQAAIALQHRGDLYGAIRPSGAVNGTSKNDVDCSAEVLAGDDSIDDDDGNVWSASVTTAQSRCTLLLLGGEGEGGRPVATSWACTLRNSKWQRLSFPLRTLPHFFHVACSSAAGCADTQHVRRQLSRTEYRTAVESLVERAARASVPTSESATPSSSLGDLHIAACHGSLAQLLNCPRGAGGAERLLLVGGSRGPPVSVATQVEVMGASLNDRASLWLLAAQQQHDSPSAALQQRMPHLSRFFFCHNSTLSHAVGSVFQRDSSEQVRQRRPLSDADARSNRLVSESVLDGQLTEWMRLARKRLRDSQ